jgi:hypothetical protein
MLEHLQKKWKVNAWRVLLILMTFAIGGSLTGYAGKRVMGWLGIKEVVVYIPVYILLITLLWPMMVMLVSLFTGQFVFFRHYLRRLGARLRRKKGSGTGKNGSGEEV